MMVSSHGSGISGSRAVDMSFTVTAAGSQSVILCNTVRALRKRNEDVSGL